MPWMIHAVTWADCACPAHAPEHHRVLGGSLCALVTEAGAIAGDGQTIAIDPNRVDQDLAGLLRLYDRLIDAYAKGQDILPMRFGLLVEQPEHAARMLDQNASYLAEGLAALSGRREITVRVTSSALGDCQQPAPPETCADTNSASGYLAERLAARKSRETAQQVTAHFVHRVLVSLESFGVPIELPSLGSSRTRLAGWTCLVRSEAVAKAMAGMKALQREAEDLGLSVEATGPHAPFSLAAEAMANGESAV